MNAIVLTNVRKQFRKSTLGRTHTTLKSALVGLIGRRRRELPANSIDVLKDINLTVPQGKTFGIIGRNGSGKSTLLKLITGIYSPTAGKIEVNGRISALLELGAGFHPEFSGRENILINGIVLGMSRAAIRQRMQQIIDFSELGDFIDEPVRTYSSGMFMRLAFAVATHVDPDILIVDEILAVGDDHFSRKSMAKMTEFKRLGKTIVLVTHDLATVQRWCDQAAWIEKGEVRALGEPGDVVNAYRRTVAEEEMALAPPAPAPMPEAGQPAVDQSAPAEATPTEAGGAVPPEAAPRPKPKTGPTDDSDRRWGNFRLEISEVRIVGSDGEPRTVFDTEDALAIEIDFAAFEEISDVVFGVAFWDATNLRVYGTNTQVEHVPLPSPLPKSGTLRLEISRLGLIDGDYGIDVAAHTANGENYDYHRLLYRFAVRSEIRDIGIVRPSHCWSLRALTTQARVA